MPNTNTTAAEDKKYREISYIEQNAKDGVLFEAWTQQWGLKVYPWYSMDKLKFSFIDRGAKGKGDSFDVCINTKKNFSFDFETLKHEVLHDIRTPFDLITILAQEKERGEKYPKRYKFVTGAKGEKSVGICNSTSGGYCINGQSVKNGKKVYANIPCTYYDIYAIVEAYDKTYAKRREELAKVLNEGIEDRERKIKASKEMVEEDPETVIQSEEAPANDTENIPAPAAENTANDAQVEAAAQAEATMPVAPKPQGIHVRTISDIVELSNGDYSFEAAKDDETTIEVRVPKSVADSLNENKNLFQKFVEKANGEGSDFTFTGKKKKINGSIEYIFEGFC